MGLTDSSSDTKEESSQVTDKAVKQVVDRIDLISEASRELLQSRTIQDPSYFQRVCPNDLNEFFVAEN